MSGATHLLSLYAFIALTAITLPFYGTFSILGAPFCGIRYQIQPKSFNTSNALQAHVASA
jgi:hypothetical protein